MSKDGTQRTWGGRFQEETNAAVAAMNASVTFDCALALEDVAGSLAHARMLRSIKIVSDGEYGAIERGLLEIASEIRDGSFVFEEAHEDVHMNIE
ncbi:MAG: argininosuccinate lyase, partial [Myxococcota bacterium]|nr:argininosuccinate lyase [Myxococcota bacterium]